MTRSPQAALSLLFVAALGLSACAGDDEAVSDAVAVTTTTEALPTTSVAEGPPASLTPTSGTDGPFIDVDAQHFCDLKSQSFESPEAIQSNLDALLAAANLTQAQWTDYNSRKEANESIRQQVNDRFMKLCP